MNLDEKLNKLSQDDLDFICQSLNFYWNDAAHTLAEKSTIGDIEKSNYLYQLVRAKEIMDKLDFT